MPPMTAAEQPSRATMLVLGTKIDVIDFEEALGRMFTWSGRRESRVVCVCNVHSVVTAGQDLRFSSALRACDLATPDGAPIAWLMRRLGQPLQKRVSGPDLMREYCRRASNSDLSI